MHLSPYGEFYTFSSRGETKLPSELLEKCDAKQFDFLFFTKNEEI